MKKIILDEEIEFDGTETMWEKEVFTGKVTIEKETEKAVFIKFKGVGKEYELDENDEVGEVVAEWSRSEGYWLPKSQVKVEGNIIQVPEWLVEKKRIRFAR